MYCRYEDFPVVCLNRARYLPWQRAQQLENDGLDACSVLIKHYFILVICKYHTFSLVGTFSRSCATLFYIDVKIVKTVLTSFYLVAVLTTPALTRPGGAVWARPGAVTDCSTQTWTWTWQRSTLVLHTIHRFHNPFSQSRRRPLLGPPVWKCQLPTSAFTFKTLQMGVDPKVSRHEIGMPMQLPSGTGGYKTLC